MLSVVVCTWNESRNLPRLVSSVKKIAAEIVVVDTESTDDTVAVAKRLGCKVFHHKNTGIVEPVRNFAISKAKSDWLLLLDADEEISATLADHILSRIKTGTADYYRIPRRNLIFGQPISSSHWWPDFVYRLFKKGSVTWDDTIHSIPFTRGQGEDFPAREDYAIIHHSYSDISQFVSRLNRYTDHQLATLTAAGYAFSWTDLVVKPAQEFLTQFFARRGYRDGLHGLALSGLQAFSEFVLYLKVWQQRGFVAKSLTPAQVFTQLSSQSGSFKWWLRQSQIESSVFPLSLWYRLLRKLGL